jgi:hypothetical protein
MSSSDTASACFAFVRHSELLQRFFWRDGACSFRCNRSVATTHTNTHAHTHTHTHVHMHKHIYIHIVQSNVTFLTCLTFLTFVDSALIGFRTPGFTTPRSPRLTPAGHKATVRLSATMLPEKVVLTCVRRISAMSNGAKRSKQPQSCRSFHR